MAAVGARDRACVTDRKLGARDWNTRGAVPRAIIIADNPQIASEQNKLIN